MRHTLSERSNPVPARDEAEALVASYRRLAQVFHEVLSEQDAGALLGRIADALGDLVPHDELCIYEADEAQEALVPVLVRGDWEEEILQTHPRLGEGITGWAALNRQPVHTNQAHLDPRVVFVPGTPPDPEALVCVPLVARGALKGVLNIYRLGAHAAFAEEEFELARWFGDAAALALDNAQARARLELQAQTDSLTGLFNHRHFHERLRSELTRASRVRDSVALIMFDLDEFKRVNDICGHAVGDQVLVAVADAARGLVRGSDVVCRLGGEEFAIIMPSCDVADALGLARRLMDRLSARPVDAAGEVTLSAGIAQGPRHGMNARELVAFAESAMMTAKADGRNRVVVFDEDALRRRPVTHGLDRDLRSIAHLKMLQSLTATLSRLREVDRIGEAIANELRPLIDYHTCRVYVVEGPDLVPVAYRGIEPPRLTLGEGLTGHVARSGRPLLVANALDSPYAAQIPGTERVDESVVAAPLRDGTRVVGVVFLSKLGVGQFDEDDLRLLEVLSGHAGVVLENARLYEQTKREAENARAWLEFADALSAADGFDAMCSQAVAGVARLLEVEDCSLWLQDDRTGDFSCVAPRDGTAFAPVPREDGERLVEDRKTPFAADGAVCAPLPAGFGVRGWLGVADAEHLSDTSLRLLDGMAYRVSMALQRRALVQKLQESADGANALLEFSRALAHSRDEADALRRTAALVAAILDMPRAYVLLEDSPFGDLHAVASFGTDEGAELRLPGVRVRPLLLGQAAFVLSPDEIDRVLGERRARVPVAVARLSLRGDRLGCLVVAARDPDYEFGERSLWLLEGMAYQATLALSR